ncbi:MAG: PCP reductase family protein, partial [Magnetococcus sp. YQC-5]
DPWCAYDPATQPIPTVEKTSELHWTPEASERLLRVPIFLRGMVKSGVQRYAREKGLHQITPELMMAMRRRVNGQR